MRLIYGSYPEVVLMESIEDRELYLKELIASYLFKDILQLEGVRHADKLLRLLQAVAFQIGGEVSVAELGARLGMSRNTVERYLDLLEKPTSSTAGSGSAATSARRSPRADGSVPHRGPH